VRRDQKGKSVRVAVQGQYSTAARGRRLDFDVPARPDMVAAVRRALAHLPLPSVLLDDAQLLTSELVTNSIRHAGLRPDDRVRIRADWGARLRVEVIDGGPATDPVAGAIRPSPGADSGWGLYLVENISARWGRSQGRYWFELEQVRRPES
jgi:anti-sigma regulatory factor (Ser/Thr protein kinase)